MREQERERGMRVHRENKAEGAKVGEGGGQLGLASSENFFFGGGGGLRLKNIPNNPKAQQKAAQTTALYSSLREREREREREGVRGGEAEREGIAHLRNEYQASVQRQGAGGGVQEGVLAARNDETLSRMPPHQPDK
jgi:hypothetical protein